MILQKNYEAWFVTGSQHLYGDKILLQVSEHAAQMATYLSEKIGAPVKIVCKPVMTTAEAITALAAEANSDAQCLGLITWMHTFSPAKMWIAGLRNLQRPLLHLHTQFNREIPWDTIDMNFMNLNQSAHGDREYGFIGARMRLARKVVVGYWQEPETVSDIAAWVRAAAAWRDWQGAKIARFGDNMREVAVTEGDKVEAQIRLGYSVHGYGVGDLVKHVEAIDEKTIDRLIEIYESSYVVAADLGRGGAYRNSLRDAARIEAGMRSFLHDGGFCGFTTTFQDLHGLAQLPGLAVQRLMAEGYGFGAEGDWKTAALLRALKVMGQGLPGGTSFMEDYTYHFGKNGTQVLGAHMLEVCESIAAKKPQLQIHPLSIGSKADPVRLVFDVAPGPAINATILDMGGRFRMLVNEVSVVVPPSSMPRLPVASALWEPKPDFKTAAAAWILAGGAHHTGFTQSLSLEHLRDFAEMASMEFLSIDSTTAIPAFKNELRVNEVFYRFEK